MPRIEIDLKIGRKEVLLVLFRHKHDQLVLCDLDYHLRQVRVKRILMNRSLLFEIYFFNLFFLKLDKVERRFNLKLER